MPGPALAACKTLASFFALLLFLTREKPVLQPKTSRDSRHSVRASGPLHNRYRHTSAQPHTEPHSFLAAFCICPGNHALPSDGLPRQLETAHRGWRHD
jgi:hypothetical protein